MLAHYKDQDFYCSFTQLPHTDREVNLDELPYTIHSVYSINKMRTRPTWPLPSSTSSRRSSSTTSYPAAARRRSTCTTTESIESKTSFPFSSNSSTYYSSSSSSTSTSVFSKTTTNTTSCGSTATTIATSSSTAGSSKKRRKRLFAAPSATFLLNMLQPSKRRKSSGLHPHGPHPLLLQRHKKPSTLDFRCVGSSDDLGDELVRRISSLSLDHLHLLHSPARPQSPVSTAAAATAGSPSITSWMDDTPAAASQLPDAPRLNWRRPDVNDDWNANWFSTIG